MTTDGYSEMVAVNYLAPWLLTNILLPTLVSSAPSRIVTVASEASRRASEFDPVAALIDISPFTARGSSPIYGRIKLMDIMFSMELARRLKGTEVAVNCVTGGYYSVFDTELLTPQPPGADRQAQKVLWEATAERLAAFCVDSTGEADFCG